jgi:hypothetical protein
VQLERENSAAELEAFPEGAEDIVERANDLDERSLWERMNGSPDELLYAGEYEQ